MIILSPFYLWWISISNDRYLKALVGIAAVVRISYWYNIGLLIRIRVRWVNKSASYSVLESSCRWMFSRTLTTSFIRYKWIVTLISKRVKLCIQLAGIVEIWDVGLTRQTLAMISLGIDAVHSLSIAQVFVFRFNNSIFIAHNFLQTKCFSTNQITFFLLKQL